jgi:hypothetical protein
MKIFRVQAISQSHIAKETNAKAICEHHVYMNNIISSLEIIKYDEKKPVLTLNKFNKERINDMVFACLHGEQPVWERAACRTAAPCPPLLGFHAHGGRTGA